jgi:CRP-like cAMP-binding protein
MNLNHLPVFGDLSPNEQTALLAQAEIYTLRTGEVLFYEGDPADRLYLLAEGDCLVTRAGKPQHGPVWVADLIDPVATLGGLPHSIKLEAQSDCKFLGWPVEALWQSPEFNTAARQFIMPEQPLSQHPAHLYSIT